MADNRIEDAKEKIAETKQAVEQSAQIAKNLASGNYLAAAKNALKMLKNEKFKKALNIKLKFIALKQHARAYVFFIIPLQWEKVNVFLDHRNIFHFIQSLLYKNV